MSAAEPISIEDARAFTDQLQDLLTGQGGAFDSRSFGNRTYLFRRRPYRELEQIYHGHWLMGQVVETPAFEMTRERRIFQVDDRDRIKALEDGERRLKVWQKVREAIQWSDLHGGGGLLLGLDGTGELDEPLDVERVQKGALKFLHALDAHALRPMNGTDATLITDPSSPGFMLPEFYQVAGAAVNRIHASRIVRFPGLPLPWQEQIKTLWWGGSRMQRVYDAVLDAETVIGGVAELITEAKIDVYKIKGLMAHVSSPQGTETVRKRIALADSLKSIYKGIIIDAEEDYDQKSNALVQGMSQIIETYLAIVSSASGIPVTKLLGTSSKGLNDTGEGDLTNFYNMIAARQETYLRPRMDDLDEVFIRSELGIPPEEVPWTFAELWRMDDAEKAKLQADRATRDKAYFDMGVIDEAIIGKQLMEEGTYSAIDKDYIADLEKLAQERDLEPDPSPDPPKPGDPQPPRDPAE